MGNLEDAKGKAKEAAGDLTDNPDLKREGAAQSEKGEAEEQASEARAEAEAHELSAEKKQLDEQAAQKAR